MGHNIRVKFQGGREVTGILKGFDKLLNLVLDETIEYIRGELFCLFNLMIINDRRTATMSHAFDRLLTLLSSQTTNQIRRTISR